LNSLEFGLPPTGKRWICRFQGAGLESSNNCGPVRLQVVF
jgi:hypothetical protein